MEYNTVKIALSDNTEVQLRLSTKALISYHKNHGIEGAPIVASVMNAVDDLEAKAALLTAAMRWPGNPNDLKVISCGEDLMDWMVSSGYDHDDINRVIVQLAQNAGLVTDDEAQRLDAAAVTASSRWVDRLDKLLRGENPDAAAGDDTEAEGNPT